MLNRLNGSPDGEPMSEQTASSKKFRSAELFISLQNSDSLSSGRSRCHKIML